MRTKTQHFLIHGRVHGVFFRDSMRREAQALGVTGRVRNRSNGSVEVVAQGEAAAVDALAQWAHRGSPHARAGGVDLKPGSGDYTGFGVVP